MRQVKPWKIMLCGLLVCSIASLSARAKDKERAWQDGILLDSTTQTGSRVVGSGGNVSTLRNDLTYYQIDTPSMTYIVARSLRSKHDKALDITINSHIQFAIEGQTCYLRDEEGKEHTLSVEKKIAKTAP